MSLILPKTLIIKKRDLKFILTGKAKEGLSKNPQIYEN